MKMSKMKMHDKCSEVMSVNEELNYNWPRQMRKMMWSTRGTFRYHKFGLTFSGMNILLWSGGFFFFIIIIISCKIMLGRFGGNRLRGGGP